VSFKRRQPIFLLINGIKTVATILSAALNGLYVESGNCNFEGYSAV